MKYLTCVLLIVFSSDVAAQANSVTPRDEPSNARTVNVSTTAEFSDALASAQPGDVIVLENGTYEGPFEINNSGTLIDPIIIRGESKVGVELVQSVPDWPAYSESTEDFWQCWNKEANLTLRGSHIYVEDLTVVGGDWGIKLRARNAQDAVVVRNTRITNVYCGISLWEVEHTRHYICDNTIEGRLAPNDRVQDDQRNFDGKKGWGVEGMRFTGVDLTICHNTLSGFGDTIDNGSASNPTINLDVFGNEILYGADDGIEIDGDTHNARIFGNRVSNSGTGISVQPDIPDPGPYYVYRNVIYNSGLSYIEGSSLIATNSPLKFKNNAENIYLYHNTSVRAGTHWGTTSQNGIVDQKNNLILGTEDSNDLPIFEPADPILSSGTRDWAAYREPGPLTLASSSYAVDGGVPVPGFSDNSIGAPDLGAHELGQAVPHYGVRTEIGPRPNPPASLNAE